MSGIFSHHLNPSYVIMLHFEFFQGKTGEISTWKFPQGFPRERRRKYTHKNLPIIWEKRRWLARWLSVNLAYTSSRSSGLVINFLQVTSLGTSDCNSNLYIGKLHCNHNSQISPCVKSIYNDKKTNLNIKTQGTIPLKYFEFCCSSHLPVIQVCTKTARSLLTVQHTQPTIMAS